MDTAFGQLPNGSTIPGPEFVAQQLFRQVQSVMVSATSNLKTIGTSEIDFVRPVGDTERARLNKQRNASEFNLQVGRARDSAIDLGKLLVETPAELLNPADRQVFVVTLREMNQTVQETFGRIISDLNPVEIAQVDGITELISRRLGALESPAAEAQTPAAILVASLRNNSAQYDADNITGDQLFDLTSDAIETYLGATGFGFRRFEVRGNVFNAFENASQASIAFEIYGYNGGFINQERLLNENIVAPATFYPRNLLGSGSDGRIRDGAPIYSTFLQTAVRDYELVAISQTQLRDRLLTALGLESVLTDPDVIVSPEEGIVELRRRRRDAAGQPFEPLARNENEAFMIASLIRKGLPLVRSDNPPRSRAEAAAIVNEIKRLRRQLEGVAPSSLIANGATEVVGPTQVNSQPVIRTGALDSNDLNALNEAITELVANMPAAAVEFFDYSRGIIGFGVANDFRFAEANGVTSEDLDAILRISGEPDSQVNKQVRNLSLILEMISRVPDSGAIPALSSFAGYAELLNLYMSTAASLIRNRRLLEDEQDPAKRDELQALISEQERVIFESGVFEQQATVLLQDMARWITFSNSQTIAVAVSDAAALSEHSVGFRLPIANITFGLDPNNPDPFVLSQLFPEEFSSEGEAAEYSFFMKDCRKGAATQITDKFMGFMITAGADPPRDGGGRGGKAIGTGGGAQRNSRQNRARVQAVNEVAKQLIELAKTKPAVAARIRSFGGPRPGQSEADLKAETFVRIDDTINSILLATPEQAGKVAVNAYLDIFTSSASGKISPQQRYESLLNLQEVLDSRGFQIKYSSFRPRLAAIFGVRPSALPEFTAPRIFRPKTVTKNTEESRPPTMEETFGRTPENIVEAMTESALVNYLNSIATPTAERLIVAKGPVLLRGSEAVRSRNMTFDAIVEAVWANPLAREVIARILKPTTLQSGGNPADLTEVLSRTHRLTAVQRRGYVALWEQIFESARQATKPEDLVREDRVTFTNTQQLFIIGQEYLVDNVMKGMQNEGGFTQLLGLRMMLRTATTSYASKTARNIPVGDPAVLTLMDQTNVSKPVTLTTAQTLGRRVYTLFQTNPTDPTGSTPTRFGQEVSRVASMVKSIRLAFIRSWIKDAKAGDITEQQLAQAFTRALDQGRSTDRVLPGEIQNLILAEGVSTKETSLREKLPERLRDFPEVMEKTDALLAREEVPLTLAIRPQVVESFGALRRRATQLRPGQFEQAKRIVNEALSLKAEGKINADALSSILFDMITTGAIRRNEISIEVVALFLNSPVPTAIQERSVREQIEANRQLVQELDAARVDVLPGAPRATEVAQTARLTEIDAQLRQMELQLAPLSSSVRRASKLKSTSRNRRDQLSVSARDIKRTLDSIRNARELLKEKSLTSILRLKELEAEVTALRRSSRRVLNRTELQRIDAASASMNTIGRVVRAMLTPITTFIIRPILRIFSPGTMQRASGLLSVFQVVEFAFWTLFIILGFDQLEIINLLGSGVADSIEKVVRDLSFSAGRIEKLIRLIQNPDDPNVQRARDAIARYEANIVFAEETIAENREKPAFGDTFLAFLDSALTDAREVQLPTLKTALDRKLARYEAERARLLVKNLQSQIRTEQQRDPVKAETLRVELREAQGDLETAEKIQSGEIELSPATEPPPEPVTPGAPGVSGEPGVPSISQDPVQNDVEGIFANELRVRGLATVAMGVTEGATTLEMAEATFGIWKNALQDGVINPPELAEDAGFVVDPDKIDSAESTLDSIDYDQFILDFKAALRQIGPERIAESGLVELINENFLEPDSEFNQFDTLVTLGELISERAATDLPELAEVIARMERDQSDAVGSAIEILFPEPVVGSSSFVIGPDP